MTTTSQSYYRLAELDARVCYAVFTAVNTADQQDVDKPEKKLETFTKTMLVNQTNTFPFKTFPKRVSDTNIDLFTMATKITTV